MLLIGVTGSDNYSQTAAISQAIMATAGWKSSIVDFSVLDSKYLGQTKCNTLKNYSSELEKNGVNALIIKVSPDNYILNSINDIHFNMVVSTGCSPTGSLDERSEYNALMKILLDNMRESDIAIINVDDRESLDFLQHFKPYVITYGFNSEASLTASSIADTLPGDSFICCLQKSIATKNGLIIEPRELSIKFGRTVERNSYDILAAATLAIANGMKLDHITIQ